MVQSAYHSGESIEGFKKLSIPFLDRGDTCVLLLPYGEIS